MNQETIEIPKWLLLEARNHLKTYLDETGGCDHTVGICSCDLIISLERMDEILNIKDADSPTHQLDRR